MLKGGKMGRLRRVFEVIFGYNVINRHFSDVICRLFATIRGLRPANLECVTPVDDNVESVIDHKEKTTITFKGLDVVRQYAALLERRVQSSTRVRKAQVVTRQTNPIGRSMIEMLGVLAIIAVLSVGGIAGYSKAMEKYKLNKWKEDLVMLISNLNTTYINSKNYTETHEKNLTDFFEELKIVPENMLDEQNNDIFGNNLQISSHVPSRTEFGSRLFLYFWTLPNHSSVEECKTLFDIALQYEGAWATVLNENTIRKLGGILSICGKAAPADYAEWMHCKPYNIGEIAENCNVCAKQKCDIKLIINNGI